MAALILVVILLMLLAGLTWFVRHSRTEAWWESGTRKAMLQAVVALAPFLGGHYEKPRPQPTVISTPAKEGDEPSD